jgi:hypothetical protein
MKRRLSWIALGGLAFWAPALMLTAVYRWNVSVTMLNVGSLAGVAFLGLMSWIASRQTPEWGWVLAGIYIFGPTAMMASSSFDRFSPLVHHTGDWMWLVGFCLFPPMTLWLATLNGMILSVLLVTVVLPLIAISRSLWASDHR